MKEETPSGIGTKSHDIGRGNTSDIIENIQDTGQEVAYTVNEAQRNKYEANLRDLDKNERRRRSRLHKFLKEGGKAAALAKELGGIALQVGGGIKNQILPHYFYEKGLFSEFIEDNVKLHKSLLVEPISQLIKNKEKIQALIWDLKASGLTDLELSSLNTAIAKHQETCVKYPTEILEHVEKRYETCRSARDRIKSLIDKYSDKFLSSHVLEQLYVFYNEECKVLESNRENLQDRKKIWDKAKDRKTTLETSKQDGRQYMDDYNRETDPTKKEEIRRQQESYLQDTYRKRYELLKETMKEQIEFLLTFRDRKIKNSPPEYKEQISKAFVTDIAILRNGLKTYMADLGITREEGFDVQYRDAEGNEQTFAVIPVELSQDDTAVLKSIRIKTPNQGSNIQPKPPQTPKPPTSPSSSSGVEPGNPVNMDTWRKVSRLKP